MTFRDVFKSSFLENVTSVSIFDMVLAMVLAFALGICVTLLCTHWKALKQKEQERK